MAEQQASELSPQDYLNKVKSAYDIKQNLETKFIRDEDGVTFVLTTDDISKKPTSVYWKGCKNGDYRVAPNVNIVKVLIEDCHDSVIDLRGKITTNIVEIWKCNNLTLLVDTPIYTCQVDLCTNLTITYNHKIYLGSIVQAGIYGFNVKFNDYPELDFLTGYEELKKIHPDINDKTDQFITRFIKGSLLTEEIVRLANGYHTTEREQAEMEADPAAAKEADLERLLKLAPETIGLSNVGEKSKQGKDEKKEREAREAKANLKKHQGNNYVAEQEYEKAAKCYTEGIQIFPESHLLFSNRCWAYMCLKDWTSALEDAEKCTELCPQFGKGFFRKGLVLLELNRPAEAVKALTEARDLEPKSEEVLEALERAKKAAAEGTSETTTTA